VKSESDATEADSEPNTDSPVKAISRALVRAVGGSSPPTDDAAEEVEPDSAVPSHDLGVDETGGEGTSAVVGSAPVAADSTDITADNRPADSDRVEVADIRRHVDEVGSRVGVASDIDSLVPGVITRPEPPAWVNMAAYSRDGVDCVPVASGPFATRNECRKALGEAMKRAVDEYIDEQLGRPGASEYVVFDLSYIKTRLRHADVYQEPMQASFGPMLQQHALLEFDRDFREEIQRHWDRVKVMTRLAHVSLAAAAILAGLATVFAYLRLDTATKGYYTGRLRISAGAVILGLVALGILTARWIPWL
jgi:hypothetical protein